MEMNLTSAGSARASVLVFAMFDRDGTAVKISERVRHYPGGFHERQAARDRLPSWAKTAQLLILFVCWPVLGLAWFAAFKALYDFLHPHLDAFRMIPSCAGIIAFSALFGTIPLALLAVNLVLWLVPPLRRANESAAQNVPGMTFRTANEDLLSVAQFLTPASAVAGLVGAWGPWV